MKAKWGDMEFSSFLKGGTEILLTCVSGGQFIFMNLIQFQVAKNDIPLT